MIGREDIRNRVHVGTPSIDRHHHSPRARFEQNDVQTVDDAGRFLRSERSISREGFQIPSERSRVQQRANGQRGIRTASAALCRMRSGVRRRRTGGRRSMNVPPPIVRCPETSRTTKQSNAVGGYGGVPARSSNVRRFSGTYWLVAEEARCARRRRQKRDVTSRGAIA